MKYPLLFLLLFVCVWSLSNAQDRIFLRTDSIVSGKIIYADSLKVKIRLTIRPDGPDYIFGKSEIIKIELGTGKITFYKHKYLENSIGLTGAYYYNPSTGYNGYTGNGTYINYESIIGKYPSINYQSRVKVIGMKFGIGYGNLKTVTRKTTYSSYFNHYGSGGYTTSFYQSDLQTTNTDKLNFNFSIRINGTANRRLNPFFSVSAILNDASLIHLFGLGIQVKTNKNYFLEIEFAKGKWHGNYDNEEQYGYIDEGKYLTQYTIGIYRILELNYKNGK